MRAALLGALVCLLMAGCDVPPPPKPSPYRVMIPECVEVRSASCPLSVFIHS